MLGKLLRLIKQAGATSESKTERPGFISWKAETHALFGSAALTLTLLVSGNERVLGALAFIILYGNRGGKLKSNDLIKDMVKERAYTAGGVVIGAIIALAYSTV